MFKKILLLLAVVISSSQVIAQPIVGPIAQVRTLYTGSNVTTGGWTEVVASTSAQVSSIEIFDSSGSVLALGVGSAGNEVTQLYILPGGNGLLNLLVPSGSRISLKAISANPANGTENDINLYR